MTDVAAANLNNVKRVTEALIAAFQKAYDEGGFEGDDYDGELPYLDGLMAAHNFHKQIVLDIAHRKSDSEPIGVTIGLLLMARDTFNRAMEREIARLPGVDPAVFGDG